MGHLNKKDGNDILIESALNQIPIQSLEFELLLNWNPNWSSDFESDHQIGFVGPNGLGLLIGQTVSRHEVDKNEKKLPSSQKATQNKLSVPN